MHQYIAKHWIYLPIQKMRKQPVQKYLNALKNNELVKNEEITKQQEKKLAEIVQYAYRNVPYYHDLFDRLGIVPEKIQTIKDLKQIPILSKRTILGTKK